MTVQDVFEWVGITSAGGVIGWLSGRRKTKAEGVEATILVFERTVKHLEEQVEELRKENKKGYQVAYLIHDEELYITFKVGITLHLYWLAPEWV